MRKIFIVAAKVLGLYQFFIVLDNIVYAYACGSNASGFSALLTFALASVLVFKTAWLADKVGLAENKNSDNQ